MRHAETPANVPRGPLSGRAPTPFDVALACGHWEQASSDEEANQHTSFPEKFSEACYVPVRYDGERAAPDSAPEHCKYPKNANLLRLENERDRYRLIENGAKAHLPPELACDLSEEVRRRAAHQNRVAMERVLSDREAGIDYPYSAVSVFGFGHRDQGGSVLVRSLPGERCRPMSKEDLDLLTINVTRAGRAALAHAGRVAPLVITSGGSVHSPLVEAFALAHLVTCRFGVPHDRVMVDPCADHTHTNVKHTASLVVALGGRTAYVVTDDHLQRDYLEEWTFFDLLGGSIDQRSLRDFGYLLGTWRRASVGMNAGFWFTPYRFWAEPKEALGSFACTR